MEKSESNFLDFVIYLVVIYTCLGYPLFSLLEQWAKHKGCYSPWWSGPLKVDLYESIYMSFHHLIIRSPPLAENMEPYFCRRDWTWHWSWSKSADKAIASIQYCIQLGITWADTMSVTVLASVTDGRLTTWIWLKELIATWGQATLHSLIGGH